MPFNFYKESDTRLRLNRFARLGTWYILALSIVATVIITGQVLIQRHLKNQQTDSHIINVAGKQRMLSQKISKLVLLIHDNQPGRDRAPILNELNESLRLWKFSQEGLLNGNDSLQLIGENVSGHNNHRFPAKGRSGYSVYFVTTVGVRCSICGVFFFERNGRGS